jgi:hypothetical protein
MTRCAPDRTTLPGEGANARQRRRACRGLLGQHLGASHHDSSTRESGKIVRLGESGVGRVQSSPDIIHDQKTI